MYSNLFLHFSSFPFFIKIHHSTRDEKVEKKERGDKEAEEKMEIACESERTFTRNGEARWEKRRIKVRGSKVEREKTELTLCE